MSLIIALAITSVVVAAGVAPTDSLVFKISLGLIFAIVMAILIVWS